MTSICHNCGATKSDPFQTCPQCGKAPQSDDEVALAMMLSGDFLPPEKLAATAAAIKSGQRLALPPKMRAAVLSAMKAARKRSRPPWWIPWIKPAVIVGTIAAKAFFFSCDRRFFDSRFVLNPQCRIWRVYEKPAVHVPVNISKYLACAGLKWRIDF